MNNAHRAAYDTDLFGDIAAPPPSSVTCGRFILPPFSVLSAGSGDWAARKRAWRRIGIKGELGRGDALLGGLSDFAEPAGISTGGTSVFDPVLTELAYTWWCPRGGQIVDPFAGGSVRGIVAAALGFQYWGCDLSDNQVRANRVQAADILSGGPTPEWISGDSMEELSRAPSADFVFTCPPYGDLEQYSDDKRDLSTMEYHTFIAAYRRIIMRAAALLREDRFACVVVGNFRNKRTGALRDFVGDTVRSFAACGLDYYNELVLATPLASAPMRVGGQFDASRKVAKVHQNVLVFCKGSPKAATAAVSA